MARNGPRSLPDCETASLCIFFSLFSFFLSWAHTGERKPSILALPSEPTSSPRWCRTLQGAHSPGPCLPGIMQSLMDSAQGRQGREGPGCRTTESRNSKPTPPPPPPPTHLLPPPISLNPSVSTHELPLWHTQVDQHTHGLPAFHPPRPCCFSITCPHPQSPTPPTNATFLSLPH